MKKSIFNFKKFSFVLLSFLLLFSCSKDSKPAVIIEIPTTNPPTTTVTNSDYVLTNEFRGPKNALILWKDGVSTEISDGTYDEVGIDMKISGNDVYILAQVNFTSTAKVIRIYKNGTPTDITVPSATTNPKALDVVGNDVYIAGSFYNSVTNNETLAYWKNGTKTDLLSNVFFSTLNDIKVIGNSVYVLGSIRNTNGNSEVTYWKDGIKTNIVNTIGINSEATSFDLVNSTYHIAGINYTSATLKKVPFYWNNQNGLPLTTLAPSNVDHYAQDIIVSNGNVYIVGEVFLGKFQATIWKDGVQTILQPSTTYANFAKKVQVNNTITYVGGDDKFAGNVQKAIVWKNGVGTYYLTNSATESALKAMYFKQ